MQGTSVAATTTATIRVLTTSWQAVSPRDRVKSIVAIVAILGLSALIVALPIDYRALGDYGYLGVFAVTLLSTASLVLPVPYLATIYIAGSFLDPKLVAVVAGLAAALGELTGYAIGYSGRSVLPESRWYAMIERAMRKYGVAVVLGASIVPNPFFDAVGMVAGATKMRVWHYIVAAFIGKTLRFWLFAFMGLAFIGS